MQKKFIMDEEKETVIGVIRRSDDDDVIDSCKVMDMDSPDDYHIEAKLMRHLKKKLHITVTCSSDSDGDFDIDLNLEQAEAFANSVLDMIKQLKQSE